MGEKDHRSNKSSLNQPSAGLQSILAMSNALQTGLSLQSLNVCLRLIELDVDPTTLAEVIKELRKTVAASKNDGQVDSDSPNVPYTRNG